MAQWQAIVDAVGVALGGDSARGRELLLGCWHRTEHSDWAQRCVLAHYLADLEPDTEAEVAWDETALAAFRHVGDTDLQTVGIRSARGLAPSLHLNLGDGYRRLGRLAAARAQLDAGLAAVGSLPDDGYAVMIRGGLTRLQERLDHPTPA